MSDAHEIATVLAHEEGAIALLLYCEEGRYSDYSLSRRFGEETLDQLVGIGLISRFGFHTEITPLGMEMVQAVKRGAKEIDG